MGKGIESQLFDLIVKLSGLKDKDEVISKFEIGLKSIFKDNSIRWCDIIKPDNELAFLVKNGENIYGYILLKKDFFSDKKSIELLNKSIKIVANIIDGIEAKKLCKEDTHFQDQFSLFMSHLPSPGFIKDKDSNLIFANNAMKELIGWSERDFGKHTTQLVPPEFAEKMVEDDKRVLENGPEVIHEEVRGINGRLYYYETHKFPFYKENGDLYLGAIAIDETERILAEEALLKSEEKFRLLLNSTAEAIYGINLKGECTFCNSQSVKQLGYDSPDDLLGRNMHDLIHYKHSDGSYFDKQDCKIFKAFNEGENTHVTDEVFWKADGSCFPVEYWSYPQRRDGKITGAVVTFIDITERIETQKSLDKKDKQLRLELERELRERKDSLKKIEKYNSLLKAILESSPDVILFALDSNYNYLAFNNMHKIVIKNIWGKEIKTGMNMLEIFGNHPDGIKAKESFDRALAGESFSLVEEYGDELLNRVYWQNFYSPIYSHDGVVTGFTCFVLNITQQRKVEESLRETKEYLENLLKYANTPIIVWDNEFKITQFNKAFERITGLTMDEVRGKSVDILLPLNSKEGSLKLIKDATIGDRWEDVEIDVQHINGEVHTLLWNSAVIHSNDEKTILATIAQGHDITLRKKVKKYLEQSELKFRTIINSTSEAIFIHDPETGDIIDCNKAAYEMYGYTEEEFRHLRISDFSAYDENYTQENAMEKIFIAKETGEARFDWKGRKKDNTKFFNEVSLKKTIIDNEEVIIAVVRDVDERMKLEEEIIENGKRLIELNATKDKFFSIIAHDLRSPFSSILGLTELMEEDEISVDQVRDFTKTIRKTALSTYDLLENLLEWSKLQRDMIKTDFKFSSLKQIIDNSVEHHSEFAFRKEIKIISNVSPSFVAEVDERMISSVVRNILSNAIKFSNRGGKVEITAEEDGSNYKISIADSGIGMSESRISKLFKIDSEKGTPGTEGERSSGLGMILCKEFIDKHGGKIWAKSEPGKGSTFCFTIPKYQSNN
jgi:hypothetical protein